MLIEFLKIISPILAGFLSVGGIGAYFSYKSKKPINEAEAKKVNAEVAVTFADGWQKYAQKLEDRLAEMDRKVDALSLEMNKQAQEYREIIQKKDVEIKDLQNQNHNLELRIEDLESELVKYKKLDGNSYSIEKSKHKHYESQ